MNYYINLFHGRDMPGEQMEDWGFEGPVVGPMDYISWTYGHVKLHDRQGTLHHIRTVEGLVPYRGKFYGDFGIVDEQQKDKEFNERPLVSLDEFINGNQCAEQTQIL